MTPRRLDLIIIYMSIILIFACSVLLIAAFINMPELLQGTYDLISKILR